MTSWIAGLNHGAHDASATLLKDGQIVASVEQERLSRVKRAPGQSPAMALDWCLRYAGIKLTDLDLVALGSDHSLLAQWMAGSNDEEQRMDDPERLFPADIFGGQRPREIMAVPHHLAHAASCFLPSPFRDAAVLVVDAMGENCSTSLGCAEGNQIELLETFSVDDSLGYFYEAATIYAGFPKHEAGKLMGLAAYGSPRWDLQLMSTASVQAWPDLGRDQGDFGKHRIRRRRSELIEHFAAHAYPYTPNSGDTVMAYKDFAAVAQRAMEESLLRLARRALSQSASNNLVMAGGVALNCSANGRLGTELGLDGIYIQPMANDSGVALGAALYAASQAGQPRPAPMTHGYLGIESTQPEVREAFARAGLEIRAEGAEAIQRVADVIGGGGIVAWHVGRSEVGPRALGARSLLGNPCRRETLPRVNRAKKREMWRPLAPSVIKEKFSEFFRGQPNEFMIVAAQVRSDKQPMLPAVTHIDGSARPQVVTRSANPAYYDLLIALNNVIGVPVVLNTSLNVQGEPIAATVEDSIRAYRACGAEALYVDGVLAETGS